MNVNQQLEQIEAFLRDLAPVLLSYYSELVKQGFTTAQAFEMTRDCNRFVNEKK